MQKNHSHRKKFIRSLVCILVLLAVFSAAAEGVLPGLSYYMDFSYLKKIDTHIVAWLRTEDGVLDRAVFQGKDNEYYTKHAVMGTSHSKGEIYLDCDSQRDFSENVWYLYGCTAKDAPLNILSGISDRENFADFPAMVLMTPDQNYKVEVFAAYPTNVSDKDSWRIDETSEKSFAADLTNICGLSTVEVREELLPQYGEKTLVFLTRSSNKVRTRTAVFAKLTPYAQTADDAVNLTKTEMDSRDTENGYVTVEGIGQYYLYAQDDPLWAELRFEAPGSNKVRRFHQGGCGPTAVAIAVANLVPKEELPLLGYYADKATGFTFCSCSVNEYRCNKSHMQYQAKTEDEFLRYLPIIIANYTTGNNEFHRVSRTEAQGTRIDFVEDMCEIFSLTCTYTRYAPEALELVKEGKGNRIAVCSATSSSPFTGSGHFIVLAYVDDEYAYYLDPLRGNKYESDPDGECVERVAPGVVRIKVEEAVNIDVSPYFVLENPD